MLRVKGRRKKKKKGLQKLKASACSPRCASGKMGRCHENIERKSSDGFKKDCLKKKKKEVGSFSNMLEQHGGFGGLAPQTTQ